MLDKKDIFYNYRALIAWADDTGRTELYEELIELDTDEEIISYVINVNDRMIKRAVKHFRDLD